MYNRSNNGVIGLATGLSSLGGVYDVTDVIPLSTNVNYKANEQEIIKTTTAHVKMYSGEIVIGYFIINKSVPQPDASNSLHSFFVSVAHRAPLFIAAGFDNEFVINAYSSTMPTDDSKVEFKQNDLFFNLDTMDKLIFAATTESVKY
ncbi:JAB1/MPN/MOV34 metalloenzyme domain-containing protein [Entamoeba marina]